MEYEGSGVAAPILKVAPVPIISKAECGAAGVYPNRLTNSMFCAGKLKTGGVDGCQGSKGERGKGMGVHERGKAEERKWLPGETVPKFGVSVKMVTDRSDC